MPLKSTSLKDLKMKSTGYTQRERSKEVKEISMSVLSSSKRKIHMLGLQR